TRPSSIISRGLCLYCSAARPGLHSFPTRRSSDLDGEVVTGHGRGRGLGYPTANLRTWPRLLLPGQGIYAGVATHGARRYRAAIRSEEHTSELQSRGHLVCRLLLERKKRDDAHANL